LERKSTEYAFIAILFLVDSIVPHNIRKCCIPFIQNHATVASADRM
jgi:hypothetical protein